MIRIYATTIGITNNVYIQKRENCSLFNNSNSNKNQIIIFGAGNIIIFIYSI
jgi:hypothetical protein